MGSGLETFGLPGGSDGRGGQSPLEHSVVSSWEGTCVGATGIDAVLALECTSSCDPSRLSEVPS